jgi:hypothetical protein
LAHSPTLLSNKMPNGLYWTTLSFGNDPKAHKISSNGRVSFAGYVYGFGFVDAYGWPISGGKSYIPIATIDTLAPVLTHVSKECKIRVFRASEERNIPNPPRTTPLVGDHVETGIKDIRLQSSSANLRVDLGKDSTSAFSNAPKTYSFSVAVIDSMKAAYGTIEVVDWNNNRTQDTMTYTPVTRVDSLKPIVELKANVGVLWDFEIRDNQNIPDPTPRCPSGTIQVDAGLKSVQFDSLNMRMIRPLQRVFPAGTYTSSMTFEVIDITKAGWGCVTVFDNAGNSRNFCQQYNPSTSVEDHDQQQPTVMSYAEGQLTVNASSLTSASIVRIYSVDGRLVSTQDLAAHSILHVPLELTRGAYMAVHDTHGNLRSTISFVIP